MPGPTPLPAETRFARHYRVGGPDECWPWLGAKNRDGYGVFGLVTARKGVRGVTVTAHVYAFERVNGPLPPGTVTRHSCDNPPCVNPAHLKAGTQLENVKDRDSRGRGRGGGSALLGGLIIAGIHARRAAGAKIREIGVEYGISYDAVVRALKRTPPAAAGEPT